MVHLLTPHAMYLTVTTVPLLSLLLRSSIFSKNYKLMCMMFAKLQLQEWVVMLLLGQKCHFEPDNAFNYSATFTQFYMTKRIRENILINDMFGYRARPSRYIYFNGGYIILYTLWMRLLRIWYILLVFSIIWLRWIFSLNIQKAFNFYN